MDPGLALIMSNFAHCDHGRFIFDPFVGTVSLLVSAAYHGAMVTGTDIDYNLLHGRGERSKVKVKDQGQWSYLSRPSSVF